MGQAADGDLKLISPCAHLNAVVGQAKSSRAGCSARARRQLSLAINHWLEHGRTIHQTEARCRVRCGCASADK